MNRDWNDDVTAKKHVMLQENKLVKERHASNLKRKNFLDFSFINYSSQQAPYYLCVTF